VRILQKALATRGFDPGDVDGQFGPATEAAVLALQRSDGLLADGLAGPRTATALGLADSNELPSSIPDVTVEIVSRMFPEAPIVHIRAHLPPLLAALEQRAVSDRSMVLVALAAVRAESDAFLPTSEATSRFNTSPSGRLFDLYDNRKDLGNLGPPDGATFVGRGFVQLRGRAAYRRYGPRLRIPCDLERHPALACATEVAADLLALFLADREIEIRRALLNGFLREARQLANGGSDGMERFADAFETGDRLLDDRDI